MMHEVCQDAIYDKEKGHFFRLVSNVLQYANMVSIPGSHVRVCVCSYASQCK